MATAAAAAAAGPGPGPGLRRELRQPSLSCLSALSDPASRAHRPGPARSALSDSGHTAARAASRLLAVLGPPAPGHPLRQPCSATGFNPRFNVDGSGSASQSSAAAAFFAR